MDNKGFPIKSEAVWLGDVIKGKYHIPAYQRPYEWGEKNIDDFLTSIFDGYKEKIDNQYSYKPVFFGTIQLNKEDKRLDDLDIVDGQQRLTTFLLFLDVLQSRQNNVSDQQISINCLDVIDYEELKNALSINEDAAALANNPSRYVVNKKVLSDKIRNYYEELGSTETFFTDVIRFVLDNVYFVRLDTEEMDLSDVVSVFNTINTTGLDLNASDVFKFRYYDYLRKSSDDKTWMEKINECYKFIENNNEECNAKGRTDQSMINMSWVLDIYKHIICAEFEWGFPEVSKSNQKFFDDLFKGKKYVGHDVRVLEFDSFKSIVEEFVKFWRWIENSRYEDKNHEIAMELFSVYMVEKSRYSRYWTIPFVVAYFNSNGAPWGEDVYKASLGVNLYMFRFFAIYSVINDKVINVVQNKVCTECFKMFKNQDIKEIIPGIREMLWQDLRWEGDNPKEKFYRTLKSGLFYNGSRVHLICTLSALLDEISELGQKYKYKDGKEETEITISERNIQDRLFNWGKNPYDIEHILAQNIFKDAEEKEKGLFNGIGNLVVLDRSINRDIKDISVEKKAEKYQLSKYVSVQNYLLPRIGGNSWNKETVENRCKEEIKKIEKFMGTIDFCESKWDNL